MKFESTMNRIAYFTSNWALKLKFKEGVLNNHSQKRKVYNSLDTGIFLHYNGFFVENAIINTRLTKRCV